MGRIVVTEYISVDGVVEAPSGAEPFERVGWTDDFSRGPEGDAFNVFVVDQNGIAHAREVTVGARSKSGAQILEGLKAGERIVTYGAYGVQDSARVVPLTPDSAKADTGKTASGSFASLRTTGNL